MKPDQFTWSRIAMLVLLAPVLLAPGMTLYGQAAPAVKAAAPVVTGTPAATSPQFRGAHAFVTPAGVTFVLDIAGEYSYLPGNSGSRLLLVDFPGLASHEATNSHLLESPLVSSYRIIGSERDGVSSTRLELLLKNNAAADYRRVDHGLEVRLTPANGAPMKAGTVPAATTSLLKPVSSPVASSPAAVSAPAGPRANRLERVNLTRGVESTRVEVMANGTIEFKAFELRGPHRLVVDLPDVVNLANKNPVLSSGGPVHSVRVGQFKDHPPVTRVVLDLDEASRYDVHRGARGLEIEVRATSAGPEPAKKETVVYAKNSETPPALAPAASFDPVRPSASPRADAQVTPMLIPRSAARMTPPAPAPANELTLAGNMASNTPAPVPTHVETPAPPAPAPAPVETLAPPPATPAPTPGVPLAVASPAPRVSQQGPAAMPAPTGPVPAAQTPPLQPNTIPSLGNRPAAPTTSGTPKRYTGEPISINVKDVDLKDFFRLIQEISGLNVILDQGVHGSLTMVLTDVPWDQALDIVLHTYNLDSILEGNVLRIASLDTLRAEQKAQTDLALAQADTADRVTVARSLNYAKAQDLFGTLKKFLSKRADVVADDRTNQLIITDIPAGIAVADDLLKQLDKRTQQVEIEARVVSASRQFVRELGSQFGFQSVLGSHFVLGGNPVGASASPVTQPGATLPLTVGGAIPLFSNFPAPGANVGLTGVYSSTLFDLDLVLTAAEQKGIGKLLSRPKIICQNNRQGSVQQGVQVPIQTTVNNTISLQFVPVTLKLTVTPQITADGMVFMDIDVTNSTIDPGIPRINGTPALDTQEATSRVLVPDGGTVVFGGVIQNSNNLSIQQVPLLGSIPLLGNLFKTIGINNSTSELLFFVTPKIL